MSSLDGVPLAALERNKHDAEELLEMLLEEASPDTLAECEALEHEIEVCLLLAEFCDSGVVLVVLAGFGLVGMDVLFCDLIIVCSALSPRCRNLSEGSQARPARSSSHPLHSRGRRRVGPRCKPIAWTKKP